MDKEGTQVAAADADGDDVGQLLAGGAAPGPGADLLCVYYLVRSRQEGGNARQQIQG